MRAATAEVASDCHITPLLTPQRCQAGTAARTLRPTKPTDEERSSPCRAFAAPSGRSLALSENRFSVEHENTTSARLRQWACHGKLSERDSLVAIKLRIARQPRFSRQACGSDHNSCPSVLRSSEDYKHRVALLSVPASYATQFQIQPRRPARSSVAAVTTC